MPQRFKKNTVVVEEGNTISSTTQRKQDLQLLFWCFTFFYNDNLEIEILEKRLKSYCKSYLYGFEICPTTGKNHLQGFMTCSKKRRFTEIQKQFPKMSVRSCNGSEQSNIDYCSKEGNVVRWERDIPKSCKIKKDFNLSQCEIYEIDKIMNCYGNGIYETEENSNNFKKELYANCGAKYLEIFGLKSLDRLKVYENSLYVLNFSFKVSDDEKIGILGILESGIYKGKVFPECKYILIRE